MAGNAPGRLERLARARQGARRAALTRSGRSSAARPVADRPVAPLHQTRRCCTLAHAATALAPVSASRSRPSSSTDRHSPRISYATAQSATGLTQVVRRPVGCRSSHRRVRAARYRRHVVRAGPTARLRRPSPTPTQMQVRLLGVATPPASPRRTRCGQSLLQVRYPMFHVKHGSRAPPSARPPGAPTGRWAIIGAPGTCAPSRVRSSQSRGSSLRRRPGNPHRGWYGGRADFSWQRTAGIRMHGQPPSRAARQPAGRLGLPHR